LPQEDQERTIAAPANAIATAGEFEPGHWFLEEQRGKHGDQNNACLVSPGAGGL
jgi:hypothetical protein